jgi:putative flippase GtrA
MLRHKQWIFLDKFLRYSLVGGVNTVLSLSLMYLGACLGIGYLWYTAVAYSTTILLSFFMNLRYTFKTRDRMGARLVGFLLVSFGNLAIVELLEYYLIDHCAVDRPLAILAGMVWYVASGFLLNNYVVYK